MTYTETRKINGRKYYYRVNSVRKGHKVLKKRLYLGSELSTQKLMEKERIADKKLTPEKVKKANKEIQKIKGKIVGVLKKNKVTRAGIFGSYARGEQKKNSDIDILVNIEDKKMSLLGFIELKQLLEKILKKKVDLVEYQLIKSLIRDRILNDEVKII